MKKFVLFGLTAWVASAAQAVDLSGYMGYQGRYFLHDTLMPGQSAGAQHALILEPEFQYDWNNRRDQFTFVPYARLGEDDAKRNHFDIRELNWLHDAYPYEVRVGIIKDFWGVTESNHLIDIINQTDAIENTDGEDKLGQPAVQVAYQADWGTLRGYLMPFFRERTYPGVNGRFRAPIVVDRKQTEYEHDLGRMHPDIALRYSHYIGDWDFGVSHFHGTSREPLLIPRLNASGEPVLSPYYQIIDQTAIDVQATKDAWLWKLEAMTRSGQGDRFYAAAFGLEYTFYDIKRTGIDFGVIAEYSHDTRTNFAPQTILDDDIFVGGRVTWNDIQDTSLLAGAIIDRDTKERYVSAEFERRLGQNYKLELESRFFIGAPINSVGYFSRSDDYVQLSLSRYF